MTIHWVDFETNLAMQSGRFHKMMAIASKMMFLTKVSPLLSLMASPKQPQSLTGFAITIHRVRSVMQIITNNNILVTIRLRMAKSNRIPKLNSIVDKKTEKVSVAQSGINQLR